MISFHRNDIKEGFEVREPGQYGAEVKEINVKETTNGDPMLTLKFFDLETDTFLCSDNLVFSEKAKGFAYRKVEMLGIIPNEGDVFELEPEELIGCRCLLNLVIEENNGKKFLKPVFSGKGLGYEKYISN